MNAPTRLQTSALQPHLDAYLAHRDALGKKSRGDRYTLKLLDQYLDTSGVKRVERITPSIVNGFLASRPRRTSSSFNGMLSNVTCFFRWLVVHDILRRSPVTTKRRRVVIKRPFLFDRADAARLLAAAGNLPNTRGHTGLAMIHRTALILLYGLGLRSGEVSRLRLQDVDLHRQLLEIYNSKFGKDRLVPFGPKLCVELRRFIRWRAVRWPASPPDAPLLTFDSAGRRPVSPTSFTRMFKVLVGQLNLPVPSGTRSPHLHCLRHSFAVATLVRWYKNGIDPNAALLRLSTFLGHVDPSSTSVYLTITDELLEQANRRFSCYAAPVLKEMGS
jgi:integrase/recombinase XerD